MSDTVTVETTPVQTPVKKRSHSAKIKKPGVSEYTPWGNRGVSPGQYVRVYVDLKRDHLVIKDRETLKHLARTPVVVIHNARFVTYERGRERTVKEKTPIVHSYIEGNFAGVEVVNENLSEFQTGAYNPHFHKHFIDNETKTPLLGVYPVVVVERGKIRFRPAKPFGVEVNGE